MPTSMGIHHEQMNSVTTDVEHAQSHGSNLSWTQRQAGGVRHARFTLVYGGRL
jgi:hypothetical protein